MTRDQLYALVTGAMREVKPKPRSDYSRARQWQLDCEHLAYAFAKTHEGFDRERFLRDCGEPAPRPLLGALATVVLQHAAVHGGSRTAQRLREHGAHNLAHIPPENDAALLAALKADLA